MHMLNVIANTSQNSFTLTPQGQIMSILFVAIAILMILFPRAMARAALSWQFKNKDAWEPSNAAVAFTRIWAIFGLCFISLLIFAPNVLPGPAPDSDPPMWLIAIVAGYALLCLLLPGFIWKLTTGLWVKQSDLVRPSLFGLIQLRLSGLLILVALASGFKDSWQEVSSSTPSNAAIIIFFTLAILQLLFPRAFWRLEQWEFANSNVGEPSKTALFLTRLAALVCALIVVLIWLNQSG